MNYLTKTKKLYLKQHSRISKDNTTYKRIYGIYSDQNYGLGNNWFKNKIVLDLGCGNFGALIERFSKLRCKKIYACDLGREWIKPLKKNLSNRGVSLKNIKMSPGDHLKLKYKKNFFDFVASNGVLTLLDSEKSMQKAFAQGAKVCKKNGYYFSSYGVSGGLVQSVILPAVRKHYQSNKDFKKFIDNLNVKEMNKILKFVVKISKRNNGPKLNYNFLKTMLSEDFCVFLHNHIQAPYCWSNETTEKFIRAMYKKNGFSEVKRITKFVKRTDIRKFLAPLHFERDNHISKILYGDGYMQFIGKKD